MLLQSPQIILSHLITAKEKAASNARGKEVCAVLLD